MTSASATPSASAFLPGRARHEGSDPGQWSGSSDSRGVRGWCRHPTAVAMFQQALLMIHSMRLMYAPLDKIEWLLNGIYNRPLPTPGEAIVLQYNLGKGTPKR
jgi:hypothetical protein